MVCCQGEGPGMRAKEDSFEAQALPSPQPAPGQGNRSNIPTVRPTGSLRKACGLRRHGPLWREGGAHISARQKLCSVGFLLFASNSARDAILWNAATHM